MSKGSSRSWCRIRRTKLQWMDQNAQNPPGAWCLSSEVRANYRRNSGLVRGQSSPDYFAWQVGGLHPGMFEACIFQRQPRDNCPNQSASLMNPQVQKHESWFPRVAEAATNAHFLILMQTSCAMMFINLRFPSNPAGLAGQTAAFYRWRQHLRVPGHGLKDRPYFPDPVSMQLRLPRGRVRYSPAMTPTSMIRPIKINIAGRINFISVTRCINSRP